MAVMTHAPNQATTADYTTLTEDWQAEFDHVMAHANHTSDTGEFTALMLHIAGLAIPYGAEIRKCACFCWCGTVFDPNAPGAHVIEHSDGYDLGRHQFPTCADRHRETD